MEELIRRHGRRYTAPAGLAARIGAALDAAHAEASHVGASPAEAQVVPLRSRRSAVPWRPLALAASFVLAVVLSSGTTWYVTASNRQDQLAEDVVASHVRSMQAQHLTDVLSSNQHTVKPWFDGRLDLSPPVVDLTDQGYPLIGGRLDYLAGHPVAALVYKRNQHVINLFVWTRKSGVPAPQPPGEIQGYNLRQWRQGDLTCWAVSDVEGSELDTFVKDFRAAAG
jgi:anti-sigma factor RsiW